MKASLKFREEQNPLFRAKVPLNILGLPFQSGVVAGEPKELALNLSTFFETGPSIKVSYRPNDSRSPFSLVVKTGVGPYGSPNSSSMIMSAEFNLIGRENGNPNPSFMLSFKPRFGDFSFKKSQSSVFEKKILGSQNGVAPDDDSSIEMVDSPVREGGLTTSPSKKFPILATDCATRSAIAGVLSGLEVAARTKLPVRGRAIVNFRWGLRVPAEPKNQDVAFQKLPYLVMNKIGIEHVDGGESKGNPKVGPNLGSPGYAELAEACLTVKQHLEILRNENGLLKTAVEDLRKDLAVVRIGFSGEGSESGKGLETERNGKRSSSGKSEGRANEKKSSRYAYNGYPGKSPEGNGGIEEPKKTFIGGAPT